MQALLHLNRRRVMPWLLAGLASILLAVAAGATIAQADNTRDSEEFITVCFTGASGQLRLADGKGVCSRGFQQITLATYSGGGSGGVARLPACRDGQLLVAKRGEFVCGETDHFAVAPACPDGSDPVKSANHTDDALIVLGFTVEISGVGSGADVDSAWECASGGSLNIEIADASTGSDQSHMTTPGHKYVDTLTLRGPLAGGRTSGGSYEILENGAGKFKIDIQGAAVASANVESITMEDLVIDEREMTTGADWDYRVDGPGDAHFGSITIRSRVGKNSSELYQWWLDASTGKNIRKSISVIALKRDGTEARRYNLLECFPTRWDPGEYSPSSLVSVETIVAKCASIEMQAEDGARKDMVQWITEVVQGKDWKRTVTVKEILKDGSDGSDGSDGKTFNYLDCFPTRYVFPSFSASGTGNLYEEIHIKPIRLELG